MIERELDDLVAELCGVLGLSRYHNHDATRSLPGWPDLVIWGPGGLIFRELKSTDGRVSRAQNAVLLSLGRAGADVAVWRPQHWWNAKIEAELRNIARGAL